MAVGVITSEVTAVAADRETFIRRVWRALSGHRENIGKLAE